MNGEPGRTAGAGSARHRRPGGRAVVLLALAVLAAAVGALAVTLPEGNGTAAGTGPPTPGHGPTGSTAQAAGRYFLSHYELADGRVARWDQGGDTVSEGQGYAMLVAVALGDRSRFAAAWRWTSRHLQEPSGLLAWHWSKGRVVGTQPAADADVDVAWALAMAAARFHRPTYRAAATRLAAAVLAQETVPDGGTRVLVAGPWATAPVPTVNPSYFAPVAFTALERLGDAAGWTEVAGGTRQVLAELLDGGNLPPDWAVLDAQGSAQPSSPPGQHTTALYGYDAVRVPVWLAASCDPAERAQAAGLWARLRRRASSGGTLVDLELGGSPAPHATSNPVGLVAAAGAAEAAGHRRTADRLLARAQRHDVRHPTYYGTAWLALGRLMLQSTRLGGCSAAGAT